MAKPEKLLDRLIPVLLLASIVFSFVVGVLWQKVRNLEKGELVKGTEIQIPTPGEDVNQPQVPPSGKLSSDQAGKIEKVSETDHVKGSRNARVFLIEYSDFECPFCSRFHPTVKQVLEAYGNDVAWVYRHFPLDAIHPKARPAAEASECAFELKGEEGFWVFADKVFEDQTKLTDLSAIAVSVGVNKESFQKCVDEKRYKGKVENQYQGGVKAGITGTPGNLIINQKGEAWLIPGALPYESIKVTIDEALKS